MNVKLDQQDLNLLKVLQIDVKTSIEQLSDNVGLSPASVQRRLKRLRENNVITDEVAVVAPKAVGQLMTFLISVELNRDNVDCFSKFKAKIKKTINVQQCYYITGEADFVLIVTAKDMDDFNEFTQLLFFNDSNVRHFKTSVVMERTKVSLALPL